MAKKRKGERPDGLMQVSLQIGFRSDGEPDRKYFYGHSRAEAERKRDEYKERMLAGSAFSPNITVAEWVDVFKKTYRKKVHDAYIGIDDVPYNRLVAAVGWKRMSDICEADLQSAVNAVSGMSFSTVDKYVQCIRRIFLRAQKNKIIRDNPAAELVAPPSVKGTHRALERWEIDLIISNWNTEYSVAGLWVMLMLFSGLRRGEMMALDWSSVDLDARTISVCQVAVVRVNQATIEERAKTDAGIRVIPMARVLFDALSSVPEEKRSGPVCLSARGKRLSATAVRRGIEQFCSVLTRILNGEPARNPVRVSAAEQARLNEFHASPEYELFSFTNHDLRHTFATALYDAGVPVKAAQYFLGHADIRITLDLYTHLSKERDSASRQQMISFLDAWTDQRMKAAAALPDPSQWSLSFVKEKPPENDQ